MTTLKNLVDETTNIKNDIVECRDTLKQILIDKNTLGIENENKLLILIQKVNEFADLPPKVLYLYKEGNEYSDVTGGFNVKWKYSTTTASTVTKNSNYLRLYVPNTNYAFTSFSISNKIDFTYYNKLIMKVSNTKVSISASFCISDGYSRDVPNIAHTSIKTNTGEVYYELDVSNINGKYYPVIKTDADVSINVHELYLTI